MRSNEVWDNVEASPAIGCWYWCLVLVLGMVLVLLLILVCVMISARMLRPEDGGSSDRPQERGVHIAELRHQVRHRVGMAEDGDIAFRKGKLLEESFGGSSKPRTEVWSPFATFRNEGTLVARIV